MADRVETRRPSKRKLEDEAAKEWGSNEQIRLVDRQLAEVNEMTVDEWLGLGQAIQRRCLEGILSGEFPIEDGSDASQIAKRVGDTLDATVKRGAVKEKAALSEAETKDRLEQLRRTARERLRAV